MRHRKTRGHKRIHRKIEEWKNGVIARPLRYYFGRFNDDWHAKVQVDPYNRLVMRASTFPPPRGTTRQLILEALLDIHDSWLDQLRDLNVPWYLAIWLHSTNVARSRVVCRIDESGERLQIDSHLDPDDYGIPATTISLEEYGPVASRMKDFEWKQGLDFGYLDQEDIDFYTVPDRRDLSTPARYRSYLRFVRSIERDIERATKYTREDGMPYWIIPGATVWIGQQRRAVTKIGDVRG